MKLHDINLLDDSYTYSTSYRFCFPFTFAPFTTVGPLNGDFSKAISFMWHRKSRQHLEDLHHEVMQAATEHKLVRLYRFSVLAFTFRDTYKGERGTVAAPKCLRTAQSMVATMTFRSLLLCCPVCGRSRQP